MVWVCDRKTIVVKTNITNTETLFFIPKHTNLYPRQLI